MPSLNSLLTSRSRSLTDDERQWRDEIRAAEGYPVIPPVELLPLGVPM